MTTTNIAGIEIPTEALANAEQVADRLEAAVPGILALLDQATVALSAIEYAVREQTRFGRTDEQGEAVRTETAIGRIEDQWYALQGRLAASQMFTQAVQEQQDGLIAELSS